MKSYIFQAEHFGLELRLMSFGDEPLKATRQLRMYGQYHLMDYEDQDQDVPVFPELLPAHGHASVYAYVNNQPSAVEPENVSGQFAYLTDDGNSIEVSLSYPSTYADWLGRINDACITGERRPTLFFRLKSDGVGLPSADEVLAGEKLRVNAGGMVQDGDIATAFLSAEQPRIKFQKDAA